VEQQKQKIELQELNRQSKVEAQAQLAKKGSYADLTSQLAKLDIEWRKITLSSKNMTDAEKATINNRAALKQQLTDIDATQNVHTRNVGNYTGALKKMGYGVGGLTELIGSLGMALGIDTTVFQSFEEVGRASIKMTKEFTHSQELSEVQEKLMVRNSCRNNCCGRCDGTNHLLRQRL